MKNKILLASVGFIGLATGVGITAAMFCSAPQTIARATTVASIFIAGSVGLFFVGLVYPKNS